MLALVDHVGPHQLTVSLHVVGVHVDVREDAVPCSHGHVRVHPLDELLVGESLRADDPRIRELVDELLTDGADPVDVLVAAFAQLGAHAQDTAGVRLADGRELVGEGEEDILFVLQVLPSPEVVLIGPVQKAPSCLRLVFPSEEDVLTVDHRPVREVLDGPVELVVDGGIGCCIQGVLRRKGQTPAYGDVPSLGDDHAIPDGHDREDLLEILRRYPHLHSLVPPSMIPDLRGAP